MKIKILFSYVEDIVPPRCRIPRPVRFHDGETELKVTEVRPDEAPIAIRASYKLAPDDSPYHLEYRWHQNRLWTNVKCYRGELHLERVTNKPLLFAKYGQILDLRGDWRLESSEFGIFMPNVVNSKDQIIHYLNEWVKHELIIDGVRYQPCGEPHYVVMTFGLGSNHGGTACMIDSTSDFSNCSASEFSLLERDKAIEKATEVATLREDSRSLPIKPHGPDWEILIPEAIQIKPAALRFRKFVGRIKTEKDSTSCDFEFEISASATAEEIENAARLSAFKHVEWSYRQV